ncbi:uncharacterized protein [Spinacia oleracea]|uniref:Uncharacterized protein n=1 Tax=Spinacia oleracea TaxID=3562 RepID=A0ABM3RNC6_SPIOL|nr:uncharacterized protein LOC130470638 [Spinacia oleracea]
MSEFNYWVPLRALLLGLLAIALSFIAYARRVRASEVHNVNGICTYPNGSAWYFGLMAAIALLASQLAICVGMKCFCCNRNVHFTKKCIAVISMIFFVLSWIAFVIAFTGLIITAIVNNHDFLVDLVIGQSSPMDIGLGSS